MASPSQSVYVYKQMEADGELPFRINAAVMLNEYSGEYWTPEEALEFMPEAVKLSTEAGYLCNSWGLLEDRRGNRSGDDPYHIVRLGDELIFRLPGHGRKPLWGILGQRIFKGSRRFFRHLLRQDFRDYA